MTRLVVIFALLIALPAMAVGVDEQVLADPVQEAEARTIMKSLRCLVCQNQSIEKSDADMAADLRRVVRERVLAGDDDTQVQTYMVARYGDWILMQPPVNQRTWVLWSMPVILILLGLLAARALMRRNRENASTRDDGAVAPLSDDEEAALSKILHRDDRT